MSRALVFIHVTRADGGSLKSLRDMGNTVIVVEHEEEIMRAADQIIDIGPVPGNTVVIWFSGIN